MTPSNIHLDSRGIPYLTDFGLTKRAATAGQTVLTLGPMGTPAYMAPEQFSADAAAPVPDPSLAPRADVYALGCVLVTLLTGSPPYPRDTYEAALWAQVHADPPSLVERQPNLPPAIDTVVARALAKDPADRFASPGALIAAARAVLTPPGMPGVVPPPPTTATVPAVASRAPAPGPAATPRRRRSRLAATARALGILVLVAIAAGSGIGAGLLVAGSVGAAQARPPDRRPLPPARPRDRPPGRHRRRRPAPRPRQSPRRSQPRHRSRRPASAPRRTWRNSAPGSPGRAGLVRIERAAERRRDGRGPLPAG